MILTTLPDLPPRPETAANAGFRRRFYARWGRENAIVCGRACAAEYAVHVQTLSIKLACGGRERYLLPEREVVVDDDNYLVLNEGTRYGSVLRAARPAWSFAVFFRPGMAAEVRAARQATLADALERRERVLRPIEFSQHLRRHDARVTPRLRALQRAVLDGERDEDWLETQLLGLLDTLLADEDCAAASDGMTRATQRELLKRLRRAADFIESCATEPITLAQMAEVACLSRYHFVRAFGRAFGCTPHAALCAKRAALARRLMRHGAEDADAVALASGFGSRWSMRRALARFPADSTGA